MSNFFLVRLSEVPEGLTPPDEGAIREIFTLLGIPHGEEDRIRIVPENKVPARLTEEEVPGLRRALELEEDERLVVVNVGMSLMALSFDPLELYLRHLVLDELGLGCSDSECPSCHACPHYIVPGEETPIS